MSHSIITAEQVFLIFLFITGGCVGSFLNLSAYRIPLKQSILFPRSSCESCTKTIPLVGLIPILGYFLLRGKCSYCKSKISFLHPFIELFCACGTVFIFYTIFMPSPLEALTNEGIKFTFERRSLIPFLTSLWLFYTGITLSIIDIKHRILPDVITIPGIFVGFFLSFFNPLIGWQESLLGILLGFFGLYFIAKLYELLRQRAGMGFGDVKYLAFLGAALGWQGVITSLFIASIVGSIVGIVIGIISKNGLNTAIPFGPFLALAGLLSSLYQPWNFF